MTDLITGKIDAVSGSPVGGPAAGELMARASALGSAAASCSRMWTWTWSGRG